MMILDSGLLFLATLYILNTMFYRRRELCMVNVWKSLYIFFYLCAFIFELYWCMDVCISCFFLA